MRNYSASRADSGLEGWLLGKCSEHFALECIRSRSRLLRPYRAILLAGCPSDVESLREQQKEIDGSLQAFIGDDDY